MASRAGNFEDGFDQSISLDNGHLQIGSGTDSYTVELDQETSIHLAETGSLELPDGQLLSLNHLLDVLGDPLAEYLADYITDIETAAGQQDAPDEDGSAVQFSRGRFGQGTLNDDDGFGP